MGKFKQWLKQELPMQKYNVSLDGEAFVHGFKVRFQDGNKFRSVNTKGVTGSIEAGVVTNSYASKGAMAGGAVAGAVLLGPVGAVAGGLIGSAKRKGGTKIYVNLERDGQNIGIIEVSATKEGVARKFIEALHASSADPDNPGPKA